jgi:hypothetical protein
LEIHFTRQPESLSPVYLLESLSPVYLLDQKCACAYHKHTDKEQQPCGNCPQLSQNRPKLDQILSGLVPLQPESASVVVVVSKLSIEATLHLNVIAVAVIQDLKSIQ